MKKHMNLNIQNDRDSVLESSLNSLPQAELPTHVEQRILDSIRWGMDTPGCRVKAGNGLRERAKSYIPVSGRGKLLGQRLQGVAVACGICAFFLLGAAMTRTLTDPKSSVRESFSHTADPLDPSLLDYFEIMGG